MVLGNAISYLITGELYKEAVTNEEIKISTHKVLLTQSCLVCFSFLFF